MGIDSAVPDLLPLPDSAKKPDIAFDSQHPDQQLPKDLLVPDAPPCKTNAECNDGIICTVDVCSPSGCLNLIKGNYCLIAKKCILAGTKNSSTPCLICNPNKSDSSWSNNDGVSCNDNVACTHSDKCLGGKCSGVTYTCNDSNACTTDSCNGKAAAPTGCDFTLKPKFCLIAGTCYSDGKYKTGSKCEYCSSSSSTSKWSTKSGCVATLAGDGTAGFKNGSAKSSQFNNPYGVAVDSTGTVYVADYKNHVIRKIANGIVSTFAGNGAGFIDGPLSIAKFNYPGDLCVDNFRNIIVADTGNRRLRLISNGYVTTLAGDGTVGFKDGLSSTSKFQSLTDCSVDKNGTIYIADQGNQRIRRLKGAYVDTIAGTGISGLQSQYKPGPALKANLIAPYGTAVDSSLRVYLTSGNRILMISFGQIITISGQLGAGNKDGPVTSAMFKEPQSLALAPNGDIYVSETNHLIRKISGNTVSTVAGSTKGFQDGPAKSAKFNSPVDIARDSLGRLYVADYENHRIRVVYP